jgi:hypothetical protein
MTSRTKDEDLKSSPVRIGGFVMTSHTKVRLINFDPVQGPN